MSVAIIYRSMRKESHGRIGIGESSSTLGVRAQVDIPVDADGRVGPEVFDRRHLGRAALRVAAPLVEAAPPKRGRP